MSLLFDFMCDNFQLSRWVTSAKKNKSIRKEISQITLSTFETSVSRIGSQRETGNLQQRITCHRASGARNTLCANILSIVNQNCSISIYDLAEGTKLKVRNTSMLLIETGRNDDFFGAFNASLCAQVIKDQGIKLGRRDIPPLQMERRGRANEQNRERKLERERSRG